MSFVTDWNKIDSLIFFCESKIKDIILEQKEEEPDVELMIQVETEHLRRENEDLKRREIPVSLIEEGEKENGNSIYYIMFCSIYKFFIYMVG